MNAHLLDVPGLAAHRDDGLIVDYRFHGDLDDGSWAQWGNRTALPVTCPAGAR